MAKISGYLKDGAGQAVAECAIILTALNTSNQVIEKIESYTTTKEGFYEINALTGQYAVTLSIVGHPPKKVGVITVYNDSANGTLNDFLAAGIDNNEVTPLFLSQLIEERKQAQQSAQSAQKSAEQASSTLANVVKKSGDTMSGQLSIANGDSSALRLKNKKGDEIMLRQDADCNFIFAKYDATTSTWTNKLRLLNSTNSWRFENVDDVIVNNKSVLKVGDSGLLGRAPVLPAGVDFFTDEVLSASQSFTLSGVYVNSPLGNTNITGTLNVTRRYHDAGAGATLEINQGGNVFYKTTAYKSNGTWSGYGWVEQVTSGNVSNFAYPNYGLLSDSTDLNTLKGTKFGFYYQTHSVKASLENNYPISEAGALAVYKTGADSNDGGVQEYRTYYTNRVFIRGYSVAKKVWTDWVEQITTRNSTVDSNGFYKKASPILRLYATDELDHVDGFIKAGCGLVNNEAQGATAKRIDIGHYEIHGSLGFAKDGWYITLPEDANGNKKIFAEYSTDENNVITIKTYTKKWSAELCEVIAGEPVDIINARWIDIRLEMPVVEIVEQEETIPSTVNPNISIF